MKISLTNPTSGYNLQAINANFDKIEAEFQNKVLYRNNPPGESNQMESTLDMNSNRIINLPAPTSLNEAARLEDVNSALAGGSANLITYQYPGGIASTVQSRLQSLISVTDFGAVGDGVTDDTTAFSNATALGVPVYIPATSSFYVVSSLTAAKRELCWGAGIVKIAGAVANIQSSPVTPSNDRATLRAYNSSLAPTNNINNGSAGLGPINTETTRSGGYGQYGNWLSEYLITAALPAGQLDTGVTSWVTATNLTGGAVFGSWFGANTPAKNLGQTFSSGAAIGTEVNAGNRWSDFGLLADVGATRYTAVLQVVPDVIPALDGSNSIACSVSIASPGVLTLVAHGFTAGMGVVFSGAGTLPPELVKGTVYYVSSTGLTADTCQLSTSAGGVSINTTGSFVAPINVTPSWPGSFGTVTGQSVQGHRLWTGQLTRYNTIMPGGYAHRDYGGSVANQAPLAAYKIDAYWTNGIDFSGGSFSNACMKFSSGQVSGSATAGGGAVVPATVAGFIVVDVAGVSRRIPYFAL